MICIRTIELNQLPEKMARKLPKHPAPAALIGRLAIRNADQGQGVGKLLLADAIKRTLAVSDQIAIYAMVVDAINHNAKGFYEQFGFTRLSDDSPRLYQSSGEISPELCYKWCRGTESDCRQGCETGGRPG